MGVFFQFIVALMLAAGLILLLKSGAIKISLIDHPDERKNHAQPTALVGGLAMFGGFLLMFPMLGIDLSPWYPLMLVCLMMVTTGLLDDLKDVSATLRFAVQIAAMLLIIYWADIQLSCLGDLLGSGDVLTGMLVVPFTVFCGVGVMNAVNMQDGLDGLAGGQMLIFFGLLIFLAQQAGLESDRLVLVAIAGVLAGFLLFNFPVTSHRSASVFMGDAGSLLLGVLATWFIIRFSQEPLNVISPITAVWLLALPLMDAVVIMTRRMLHGNSPFKPDREHFHHILIAHGMSVRNTVILVLGVSLILAVFGLIAEWSGVPEWIMFWSFWGVFGLFFVAMESGWRKLKVNSNDM